MRTDALVDFVKALKEVLIGLTVYGPIQELQVKRLHYEYVFMFVTVGELVGLSVFPPYYVLRLLPYWISRLEPWRTTFCRPKDFLDF